MQAAMKELRSLKQEEHTMVALASKISDQLNRLKVEELALQNLLRQQNQDETGEDSKSPYTLLKSHEEEMEIENTKPLDLDVTMTTRPTQQEEEEEEEEEAAQHEDLEQYVESLSRK